MRKLLTIGFVAAGIVGLVAIGSIAGSGDGCKASKAVASACGAKKTSATSASVQQISSGDAKAGCSYHSTSGSTGAQLTAAEHAKMCNYDGKCEFTSISVKGMTCRSCESSVSHALAGVPGVIKVVSVDHKNGMAEVCFDPTKTNGPAMTAAILNKGFGAEIVQAVARSTDMQASSKMTGAEMGCCASGKKANAGTEKTAGVVKEIR